MQTVFLFLLFFSSKIGLQGVNETLAKEMHVEIIMRDGPGPGVRGSLVCRMKYTAISRKVVRKRARDNPERYCGWF